MFWRNSKETDQIQNRGAWMHILVSASASLASKLQGLALGFPGLSRTKLIFQDFPGPGNFTNTITGGVGTLN